MRILVSAKEIKQLYSRFKRLDRGNAGVLTTADFQLIPELSMNPLYPSRCGDFETLVCSVWFVSSCHRIIEVLDVTQTDQINFFTFVRALSIFSDRAPTAERAKCYCFLSWFQLYDQEPFLQLSFKYTMSMRTAPSHPLTCSLFSSSCAARISRTISFRFL